jgi:hypothetical protein
MAELAPPKDTLTMPADRPPTFGPIVVSREFTSENKKFFIFYCAEDRSRPKVWQ